MLKIYRTASFRKDFKRVLKQGKNSEEFEEVVAILAEGKPLPKKYKDQPLTDSKYYKNQRECHIEPDWFLIYEIKKDELILFLTRTGSHSELFGK